MAGAQVFTVRFHLGGKWPTNPWGLQGDGALALEPDFVTVRGRCHRTFRLPDRTEHRLRRVDIVNVRTDGPDLRFDVIGVKGDLPAAAPCRTAPRRSRRRACCPPRQT